MLDSYRRVLLIASAFVLAGCADNSDRMDLRVGLFFAENARNLVLADSEGDLHVG